MKAIESEWSPTNCPICDASDYTELEVRKYSVQQRFNKFKIELHDALCTQCGHLYERCHPAQDFLDRYYQEAFTRQSDIVEIKPDFDIDNRILLLKSHLRNGASILEIGANDGYFVNILKKNGFQADGFDPLETENKGSVEVKKAFISNEDSLADDPQKYDAVVSYYVLEHITKPKEWLLSITRSLKKDGLVVMEVPNFRLFPRESLLYEHFQHFNEFHLALLFEKCGIEVLEVTDKYVSRYFGIVIVGRVKNLTTTNSYDLSEYKKNLSVYSHNQKEWTWIREQMNILGRQLIKTQNKIRQKNAKTMVFFWGANDIAMNLAMAFKEFMTIEDMNVVDSSSEKYNILLDGFIKPVKYPPTIMPPATVPLFIICSHNYYSQIEEMIRSQNYDDYKIFDGTVPFYKNLKK